jgi:hypothetical protein
MKNTILFMCLMALVQIGYANDNKSIAHKDSVIVEFGKSGKIVLIVENKEDFEKLKNMNINEIVRELDIKVDESTGNLTIVELKNSTGTKEIITVREDGPETEVRIGRIKILVDESNNGTRVKVENDKKKTVSPPFRSYTKFDLGINNYLNTDNNLPSTDLPYAAKGWGSWNVGFNWMASQRIVKGVYWDFGLGIQWYNFKFENTNTQAVKGSNSIDFIERNDVNAIKSKISASYLMAQTMLQVDFGKMHNQGKRGLRLAAGPYVGYRLGGNSKFVGREMNSSVRFKDKQDTGLYLNNLRYGMRGEIGVGSFTLFSTYDFNTLFQAGKGPELNPVTFGITF